MSNKKILKKVLKSNIISIILLILSSYLFLQKSSNDYIDYNWARIA